MDEVAAVVPDSNGTTPTGVDAQLIEQLETLVAQRVARRDELQAEIAAIAPELKRYERALALVRGEPKPTTTSPKPKSKSHGTGISAERMARVEAAVRAVAAEQEEFRQVDVRSRIDLSSSVSTRAFELLRQANVIRLARQNGNQKWFRLTREALRTEAE